MDFSQIYSTTKERTLGKTNSTRMIRIRRDLLTRQEISTVNPIPRKRRILSRREQATQDQNRKKSKSPQIQQLLPCQNPEEHREKPHPYPVAPHERRCSGHSCPSQVVVVHGTNKGREEKRSNLFRFGTELPTFFLCSACAIAPAFASGIVRPQPWKTSREK